MGKLKFLTILGLWFTSCVFIRIDDSIDLGNNFRYIQDYPQTIIYHPTKKYEGVGTNVVEPVVISYNFNNRYIIALSQDDYYSKNNSEKKRLLYWIVDKKIGPNSAESMDSIIFYNKLKELKINLQLKNNR